MAHSRLSFTLTLDPDHSTATLTVLLDATSDWESRPKVVANLSRTCYEHVIENQSDVLLYTEVTIAAPTNEKAHRKSVNLNSRKYCAVFPIIKLTDLLGRNARCIPTSVMWSRGIAKHFLILSCGLVVSRSFFWKIYARTASATMRVPTVGGLFNLKFQLLENMLRKEQKS